MLVESSYGSSVVHNWHGELAGVANLLLIAGGGVGITAIAPLIREHEGHVCLYSVKAVLGNGVHCAGILKHTCPTFPNPSVPQFGRASLIYLSTYR